MGIPTICIGENKGADQRLCFRYSDRTIPLLLKSEISSFQLFSVLVQAGLCRTCSETTLLVFPRGGSNADLSGQKLKTNLSILQLTIFEGTLGLITSGKATVKAQ